MNKVESPSNPSYDLVHYIAKQYDKRAFPNNSQCGHINEVCKEDFFKKIGQEKIPKGIQGAIYGVYSENFCTFLHTTGQLRASNSLPSDTKVSAAAEVFLNKMANSLGLERSGTSAEKVWREVFQEVFASASIDQKQKVISLAAKVDQAGMKITQWEIFVYRAGYTIGSVLNHIVTKVILSICVWYLANKLSNRILAGLKEHVLPKLANRLVNTLSIETMGRLNKGFAILEKIYNLKGIIFLGALLLDFTVGLFLPFVRRITKHVINLVFLPQKILRLPNEIVWKVAFTSYSSQGVIGNSLKNISDQKIQATMILGGEKAFRVWMNQMKIAQTKGIPFKNEDLL